MAGGNHHDHDGHDHDGHDHGPGHRHAHGHGGHGHSHAPASFGRAFAIGIALNIGFVLIEGGAGLWTGSVALLADAGHNLSDVLGLAIAWGGATLARSAPSKRFTYGLKSSTILAALLNALLLLVALGAIVLEAVQRFGDPAPVAGGDVAIVAGIGIVVNLGTALLFASGRKGDVNIRGAFLHMAADAAVSAGVVAAGLLIMKTGAGWIDPVTSLVIAVLIFWQTWGLLRETLELALNAVPRGIDVDAVADALAALPGVAGVHHLHIWAMSTTETVLTGHLVIPDGHPGDRFLADAQAMLRARFAIGHATLQLELSGADAGNCASAHEHPATPA
jgi:cobalt-zinc-cadmium efflux system protein